MTTLSEFGPRDAALEAEIIAGLNATPRTLPPKYFYDERGSQLFEQITELPEYYPTRTEIGIMQDNIGEIVRRAGHQASLIEFGSGSSTKTRILLDHLKELAAYVPVEISRDHLIATVAQLAADYPHIEMLPVFADFTHEFDLPAPKVMPVKNIVYFPGSTIGNFCTAAGRGPDARDGGGGQSRRCFAHRRGSQEGRRHSRGRLQRLTGRHRGV